jgi:hypothetical protein
MTNAPVSSHKWGYYIGDWLACGRVRRGRKWWKAIPGAATLSIEEEQFMQLFGLGSGGVKVSQVLVAAQMHPCRCLGDPL